MAILTPEHFRRFTEFGVSGMGAKIREICECEDGRYDGCTFEEKVKMAIEAEVEKRESTKLGRLVGRAGFRDPGACVEEIIYLEGRSLSRDRILRLADCTWVGDHRNVLIVAASGGGKSYLAQALGVAACRKGCDVLYTRLSDMLVNLELARARGTVSLHEETARYQDVELLILDDFLLTPITVADSALLVDLMAGREGRTATIIASQIEPEQWYMRIKGEVMAEHALGRLVHGSIKIVIKGPDMRKHLAASLSSSSSKKYPRSYSSVSSSSSSAP